VQGTRRSAGKAGLLVVGLDFRDGNYGYPTALVDINYAIRWVKARAAQLNTRADLVGISGASSGGHLAMLAAMRPNDPRYTTAQLPAGSPAVGRDGALRGDVVAGHQSAIALP
jgi:acetyl esterase/lipase